MWAAAACICIMGCNKNRSATPPEHTSFQPKDQARITETTEALKKALVWAAPLDVTPARLRHEHGMKGLKHFVEKLQLFRIAAEWPGSGSDNDKKLADAARGGLLETLKAIERDDFHDLADAGAVRFAQDNMSYLRAAVIAKRYGLSITAYRAAIAKLLPRLEAGRNSRGPDQRMAIAWQLQRLDLPTAETPEQVHPSSRIGTRIDPRYWQKHPRHTYDLTHEIFAMTHRGARPFPFRDDKERAYASLMVRKLLDAHMKMGNHDIVAELLLNRAQLREPFDDQVATARRFLLAAQNPDGSFGRYDESALRKRKKNPRYDARIGGYLHTTMMCIWALMATS